MTFAIVRKGVIVDFAPCDSFRAVFNRFRGRPKDGSLVILNLRPGESARIGARVVVTTIDAEIATLAQPVRRRAIPVRRGKRCTEVHGPTKT